MVHKPIKFTFEFVTSANWIIKGSSRRESWLMLCKTRIDDNRKHADRKWSVDYTDFCSPNSEYGRDCDIILSTRWIWVGFLHNVYSLLKKLQVLSMLLQNKDRKKQNERLLLYLEEDDFKQENVLSHHNLSKTTQLYSIRSNVQALDSHATNSNPNIKIFLYIDTRSSLSI